MRNIYLVTYSGDHSDNYDKLFIKHYMKIDYDTLSNKEKGNMCNEIGFIFKKSGEITSQVYININNDKSKLEFFNTLRELFLKVLRNERIDYLLNI